jgi:hypothetical protein
LQAILEKSIAKGQFAHRSTTQALFQPSINNNGGDEEDGTLSHMNISSSTAMTSMQLPHDDLASIDVNNFACQSATS